MPKISTTTARGNYIREQYADWLSKYNFDYFFTATFRTANKTVPASDVRIYDANTGEFKREEYWSWRGSSIGGKPRREPYYAIKNVWQELVLYDVKRGFLVAEPHQSGDLHIHGIIAGGLPKQEPIALPWDIWHGLFDRFGRAKVEAPNKHQCVTMYCSKYLLKQQHRACDYYEVFGDAVYWRSGVLQKTPVEREIIRLGGEYV